MMFFYSEFFILFCFFIFVFLISVIFFVIAFVFSFNFSYTDKVSPYECGFDPFDSSRNTFEIRFYIIAILFLIFDLEASFLFPWAYNLHLVSSFGFWVIMDFFIELVVGFIYVWSAGVFLWRLLLYLGM